MCIEYDGVQHFKSVEYFGGDITLKNTIKRDNIKNVFCSSKGITLLRIPYTKFPRISEIITNYPTTIEFNKKVVSSTARRKQQ